MNRTPKILFVDNDARSFVDCRLPLARATRDAGFEVQVACPAGDAAGQLASEGFPFHAIPLDRRSVNPLRELTSVAALYRIYKSVGPDLVHHLRLKPVLYGSLAARLARVPAVINLLTGLGYIFASDDYTARFLRPLVMRACRVAFCHPNQRVIFQNQDDLELFLRAGVLPSEQAVFIKGSGVDTERFFPSAEPPGLPLVLMASRMLWDKGVADFVEAARISRDSGLEAQFVLVGDTDPGNPSAIPAEQLQEWDREGVVSWWTFRADMHEVLKQAHIVCLPSLREGLPRILIEAASCGRALVATDVPGCREVVTNGDNGLLVSPNDPLELAWAFRLLVQNTQLRHSMGLRSRERALRDFSQNLVCSQTLELYRTVLDMGLIPRQTRSDSVPLLISNQSSPQPGEYQSTLAEIGVLKKS